MNVSPINNNQTSFNGYVDKRFALALDRVVRKEGCEVVARANSLERSVNTNDLLDIKYRAEIIMKRLNKFMSQFHEKTVLTMDAKNNPELVNKQLKTKFKIDSLHAQTIPPWITEDSFIAIHKPSANLTSYEYFCDDLECIPQAVKADHSMLDTYVADIKSNVYFNPISRYFTNKRTAKADKFAKEINSERNITQEIKNFIENWKKDLYRIESETKAAKQTKKENIEIYNDIFNK